MLEGDRGKIVPAIRSMLHYKKKRRQRFSTMSVIILPHRRGRRDFPQTSCGRLPRCRRQQTGWAGAGWAIWLPEKTATYWSKSPPRATPHTGQNRVLVKTGRPRQAWLAGRPTQRPLSDRPPARRLKALSRNNRAHRAAATRGGPGSRQPSDRSPPAPAPGAQLGLSDRDESRGSLPAAHAGEVRCRQAALGSPPWHGSLARTAGALGRLQVAHRQVSSGWSAPERGVHCLTPTIHTCSVGVVFGRGSPSRPRRGSPPTQRSLARLGQPWDPRPALDDSAGSCHLRVRKWRKVRKILFANDLVACPGQGLIDAFAEDFQSHLLTNLTKKGPN